MEKRKWLWKRKSGEKSPGETESSESISSHSERNSDDQEPFKASPIHSTQSPEVTSKAMDDAEEDANDSMRKLREKLSAALVNVSAKDELVKQHSKVAEEAVAGWEKAENEVVALKQQVEEAAQRNSTLEDRLSHVDGALKECVRQLRQAKEEQEQKISEAVLKKTHEWEATKSELQAQLLELQTNAEATNHVDPDLCDKLESLERENSALKLEILSQSEEIEIMTIERDLSVEAAETASKQHLESIKKVAKFEAECRRLKIMACKTSSINDHKSTAASSIYVDSITDNQSDSGDSSRDLDQFKNEKAINRNITASSIEIDLMDDFLEMERLASLPLSESKSHSPEPEAGTKTCNEESYLRAKLEAMTCRVAELEEKLQKVVSEKAELEAMAHRAAELEESLQKVLVEKAELEAMTYRAAELEETLQKVEAEKAELEAMTYRAAELEENLQKVEAEKAELEAMTYRATELEEKLQKVEAEKAELEAMTYRATELEEKLQKVEAEKAEREAMTCSAAELEESLQRVEAEKVELDIALNKSQESVEALQLELTEAQMKLEVLQRELRMANESKQSIESQLISMEVESRTMCAKVDTLQAELQKEKTLSEEHALKFLQLEEELKRKQQETIANLNGEKKIKKEELDVAAGKLAECQKTIASLGNQLKSLATLEDFLIDTTSLPGVSGRESQASGDDGDWRLHCNDSFSPKRASDASRIGSENSGASGYKNDKNSPPTSSSSTSSVVPSASSQVSSEKNRTGFAKFFTRSKSGIHLEI